jgi:hypothetical protein
MHIFRHIFLSNSWWQRSDIWSQASYRYPISCMIPPLFGKLEVGIWRVKTHFPRYGVPIWSLWPNIRFLPSIVAEKNAMKTVFADLVGFYTHWTYMNIFHHIFLSNYWWQKSDIWSQASYSDPISWEAFLNPSDSCFLFADFVDFYTP